VSVVSFFVSVDSVFFSVVAGAAAGYAGAAACCATAATGRARARAIAKSFFITDSPCCRWSRCSLAPRHGENPTRA